MAGKCARAVALVADYINKTAEARDFISGWGSTIQFDLYGEEPFNLLFLQSGKVEFRGGKALDPDVVFYCNSDLFFDILTGKIDQDQAFSDGLVQIKGSIFDSVRFRHAAEIVQQKHSTLFNVLRTFSRFT
jgi:putative sterol carrier protein